MVDVSLEITDLSNPEDWDVAGIVGEGDPVWIKGANVWNHQWTSVGVKVDLPHPQYRLQWHDFDVYTIDLADSKILFAATELSYGAWGFYEPAARGKSRFEIFALRLVKTLFTMRLIS